MCRPFLLRMDIGMVGIAAISTFGAVFFGCFVYVAAMILLRGLIEEDLRRLPMVGTVGIRFLQRIGVYKA